MNDFNLQIKHSQKAKRLSLAVFHDGSVVITLPKKYDPGSVQRFIELKSNWIRKKIEYFRTIPKSQTNYSSLEIKILKRQARELVRARLEYFNKFYNYNYKKVAIKFQRTRWGSCSRHGNLNFNFKIALLPPEQADYIVVHELCHLKELNHSKNFWSLVEKTIPNYKILVAELRKTGLSFS